MKLTRLQHTVSSVILYLENIIFPLMNIKKSKPCCRNCSCQKYFLATFDDDNAVPLLEKKNYNKQEIL